MPIIEKSSERASDVEHYFVSSISEMYHAHVEAYYIVLLSF